MKISTRRGDEGNSGLFSGKRFSKSSLVFELLGDLDELNSFLGFAKVEFGKKEEADLLEKIQNDIYRIMSIVGFEGKSPKNILNIGEEDIKFLENEIEKLEIKIGNIDKFIIPGTNEKSARLHLARVVCRRAERHAVAYFEKIEYEKAFILKYLNRLSDLFFLMAYECAKVF